MSKIKVTLVRRYDWYDNNNCRTVIGSVKKDSLLSHEPQKDMSIRLMNGVKFYIDHIEQSEENGKLTLYDYIRMPIHFESGARSEFEGIKKKLIKEGWVE